MMRMSSLWLRPMVVPTANIANNVPIKLLLLNTSLRKTFRDGRPAAAYAAAVLLAGSFAGWSRRCA